MEMSLEHFYVDTGDKRNRPTPRRQQKENSPRKGIKLTAKTVDEDPASYKRWISRKEIYTAKILRTKNEKCKDYCEGAQNNVYCFFRLAIPAIFRFTSVILLWQNTFSSASHWSLDFSFLAPEGAQSFIQPF